MRKVASDLPPSPRFRSCALIRRAICTFLRLSAANSSLRLRIQDNLPKLFALLQPLVGRGGLAQRIALIDYRLQLAGEDVLHDLKELALRTHERTQERELAREEETDVESRLRAGGGAAGYDLAAG